MLPTKGIVKNKHERFLVRNRFKRGKKILDRVKKSKKFFKIESESTPGTFYEVKLDDSHDGFVCNCGVQFGLELRHNCKHVAAIIQRIIAKFCSTDQETMSAFSNLFAKIKF